LITDGTHYTPKDIGAGIPFLTVKDVSDSGIDLHSCSHISDSDFDAARRANAAPQAGDVLFSKDGTVGKVHLVKATKPFAVLSSLAILRPDLRKLDSAYLAQALRSREVLDQAIRNKTGSAIRRIVLGDLGRVKICLPPLGKQRRIAAILDQADALQTKRRAALACLDQLSGALFLELFGDPATNPKNWPMKRLGEMLSAPPIYGTMIPPSAIGKWLSLRVGNIQDWKLDLSDSKFVDLPENRLERFRLMRGDLVMARAIASIDHLGKGVIVDPSDKDWTFDSHLMRIRLNQSQLMPEYLAALLETEGGRALFLRVTRRSAVQFNVNTGEMKSLTIPVPPITLQREYCRKLCAITTARLSQRDSENRTNRLSASLQHRAFRGEL
jgi:type I restriction enzyme S subunit